MTHRPSHIVQRVSETYPWFADRTLCGLKTNEGPTTGSHAVQMHIDGHGGSWCPDCLALWRGLPTADRAEPEPPVIHAAHAQQGVLL